MRRWRSGGVREVQVKKKKAQELMSKQIDRWPEESLWLRVLHQALPEFHQITTLLLLPLLTIPHIISSVICHCTVFGYLRPFICILLSRAVGLIEHFPLARKYKGVTSGPVCARRSSCNVYKIHTKEDKF